MAGYFTKEEKGVYSPQMLPSSGAIFERVRVPSCQSEGPEGLSPPLPLPSPTALV